MPNAIGICTGGGWLRPNKDWTEQQNKDRIKRDIDNMADTGFRWVRWLWTWEAVESTRGQYNLHRRIEIAGWIKDAGMKSFAELGYTPPFYQRPDLGSHAPPKPEHYPAWGRYVAAVLEATKPLGLTYYGHWNESNHAPFWKYPDVDDQAAMLKESLAAAERVHPGARFVLGEFAPRSTKVDPTNPNRYIGINMVDYVKQWYEKGYGSLVRGPWSIHPYAGDDPANTKPWDVMTTQYDAIREVLTANRQPRKKIWGTEYGYTTRPNDGGGRPQLTEAKQAEWLVKQTSMWMEKPGAGPGFIFVYRDFDVEGDEINGLGIYRYDGKPKLARAAIKELLT